MPDKPIRELIATRSMTYATRRLQAGDGFTAKSDRDAKLLIAIKKASPAPAKSEKRARTADMTVTDAPATNAIPPASGEMGATQDPV